MLEPMDSLLQRLGNATFVVSRDAYARYNVAAPLPIWSANKARHRSRTENRQLNAALHRIALTKMARNHSPGSGDSDAVTVHTVWFPVMCQR
jgi:transposase